LDSVEQFQEHVTAIHGWTPQSGAGREQVSSTITVYRVQAADGRGPWRPGFSPLWIDDDAPVGHLSETVMDLMPIEQIHALPDDLHYGCACRTLSGLCAWFTPIEIARLKAFGFHPVRLNVDRVLAESQWQMLVGRARPFADGATRLCWPEPGDRA
jgi:hypothetical protein